MINNEINGKCSGCGHCCTSLLPTTVQERQRMKDYADAHGFHPQLPLQTLPRYYEMIYVRCPFLNSDNQCNVYPVRPAICRIFKCSDGTLGCVKRVGEYKDTIAATRTVNLWEIYGVTGIRHNGKDVIPGDHLPKVLITHDSGHQFEIRVGRPVQARLKNGEVIMDYLCLDVQRQAFMTFNPDTLSVVTTRYEDILCFGDTNWVNPYDYVV